MLNGHFESIKELFHTYEHYIPLHSIQRSSSVTEISTPYSVLQWVGLLSNNAQFNG